MNTQSWDAMIDDGWLPIVKVGGVVICKRIGLAQWGLMYPDGTCRPASSSFVRYAYRTIDRIVKARKEAN